jgi:hypothetical protein
VFATITQAVNFAAAGGAPISDIMDVLIKKNTTGVHQIKGNENVVVLDYFVSVGSIELCPFGVFTDRIRTETGSKTYCWWDW